MKKTLRRIRKATPRKVVLKTRHRLLRAKLAVKRRGAVTRVAPVLAKLPISHLTYQDLSLIIDAPAFLGPGEIPALSRHAKDSKSIVEIGAAFGASSSILLLSSPADAKVISIDPFVVDSKSSWKASPEACRRSVERLLKVANRPTAIDKWKLIEEPSYEAVKQWKGGKVEMLFIDGDHSYKAVKQDFEDWYPHVKKDGKILIHDSRRLPNTPAEEFAQGWQGPTKLAHELKKDKRVRLIDEEFSLTVWQKR